MKANIKPRKYYIISIFVIVCLICGFVIFNILDDQKLSKEQIIALREQYPICGVEEPEGMSMVKIPLEEVKKQSETFVYGEVIGDPLIYEVALSTGNSALDSKRATNGITEKYDFYEYEISVIDDSESVYSKGDVITIASNIVFKEYNPQLSNGMKIVVPVVKDDKKEGRTHYTVDGMYYVTQDEYVISAFDENIMNSKSAMSGLKVDVLLNKLKK